MSDDTQTKPTTIASTVAKGHTWAFQGLMAAEMAAGNAMNTLAEAEEELGLCKRRLDMWLEQIAHQYDGQLLRVKEAWPLLSHEFDRELHGWYWDEEIHVLLPETILELLGVQAWDAQFVLVVNPVNFPQRFDTSVGLLLTDGLLDILEVAEDPRPSG